MPHSASHYGSELKKFVTSQYIYTGLRVSLAIIIPSVIFAQLGILKEFFLFPLGTSFVGLTDMPGPFIRRRNALIFAIICFIFVAATASFLKDYPILIFFEIGVFGIFFTMLGVYGLRLAAVGSLTLVVLSIFIDGHLSGGHVLFSLLIFAAGCIWFLLVFLLVTRLQPYKLASQMIGENYLLLAKYLEIKAGFYLNSPNYDALYSSLIREQVEIKNLQEETREVVFKTRQIVSESTTTSRLLMLSFLNSIDLYEKLITADQDYRKIHARFAAEPFLNTIHQLLMKLSEELVELGIALQSGLRPQPKYNLDFEIKTVYDEYYELRNRKLGPDTLEDFLALRQVVLRADEFTTEVKTMFRIAAQDLKNAKSLSTTLDLEKFVPKQEPLNLSVFFNNFSLKSSHFRHAVRVTFALLIGYAISRLPELGIGHSYWILITILAIMRPAYSTTKYRNRLRIYGTLSGGIVAYLLLMFVQNNTALLAILFISMTLCFALLKGKYSWAVFFMTIYIFITFNFMNPGQVNTIFKDRIIDTIIAGIIAFAASYFILPLWEKSQNINLMRRTAAANEVYFTEVINRLQYHENKEEKYRILRKDAIISLANLSDNFQRMLSDPKNQQERMTAVHQFVNTAHLITAYTASLAQFTREERDFPEIDWQAWQTKITAELNKTAQMLNGKLVVEDAAQTGLKPQDDIEALLRQRKNELEEERFYDHRDPRRTSRLMTLQNIKEILELLYDAAHEQQRTVRDYLKTHPISSVA